MDTAERRCESMWSRTIGDVWVRCDRWGGHAGEHRGHDVQDMEYRWPDSERNAKPQPEDRRLGQEPVELSDELRKALHDRDVEAKNVMAAIEQLRKAHRKIGDLERQRDEALARVKKTIQQRDEALRESASQETQIHELQEHLHQALEKLETVQRVASI